MNYIYKHMHDAIRFFSKPCELITIGCNFTTGSEYWQFPDKKPNILKSDITMKNVDFEIATIDTHSGILIFIDSQNPNAIPAKCIRENSIYPPSRNTQSLCSGCVAGLTPVSSGILVGPRPLVPVQTLGIPGIPKFFIFDVGGMNFDISLKLINCPEVIGFGCNYSLMSCDEVVFLRCAAVEQGYKWIFGDKDAIFLRETLLSVERWHGI